MSANASQSAAESVRSPLATLVEAAKPFARIASWHGLHDQNSDKLPATITIKFPNGEVVSHLTAKDFRLISDALEAATLIPAAAPKTDAPGICGVCGQPMPPGEEMFKFHGYSGPCPTPLRERVAAWAASPHGKEALQATADNVRKAIDQIDQDSKVDWKTMSEPLTATNQENAVSTPALSGAVAGAIKRP